MKRHFQRFADPALNTHRPPCVAEDGTDRALCEAPGLSEMRNAAVLLPERGLYILGMPANLSVQSLHSLDVRFRCSKNETGFGECPLSHYFSTGIFVPSSGARILSYLRFYNPYVPEKITDIGTLK